MDNGYNFGNNGNSDFSGARDDGNVIRNSEKEISQKNIAEKSEPNMNRVEGNSFGQYSPSNQNSYQQNDQFSNQGYRPDYKTQESFEQNPQYQRQNPYGSNPYIRQDDGMNINGYNSYYGNGGQNIYRDGRYDYPPYYAPKKEKKEKKPKKPASKGFVIGMIAIGMVISMFIGFCFSSFLYSDLKESNKNIKNTSAGGDNVNIVYESTADTPAVTEKGDAAYVASVAAESVVEITTENVSTDTYFGQYVTQHAGSGVIISSDDSGSYIITCAHVIEGANKITVRLKNGSSYEATKFAGDTQTDIGIVKIDVAGLKPVTIADFSDVTVGERVVAIGNPLGSLGGSVTEGIVSALDRDIIIDGTTYHLLQTDTAVNPGNSGGGLFNAEGKLIGIVNAKSAEENIEGIGFAIPIDSAMKIATELIENGYVTGRVKLGVTLLDIRTQQDAYNYYLQYGIYFSDYGIYIIEAEDEKLHTGDRIVALDNMTVDSVASLKSMLLEYKVGDKVKLTVSRLNSKNKAELMDIELVLKEMTN